MKEINNPWHNHPDHFCIGCDPRNPFSLNMTFFEDGDDVVCNWTPRPEFQGWINVLHGGIQSLMIDETAAWVVTRFGHATGVTSKLECQYKKAININDGPITVRARIKKQMRRIFIIDAEITNSQGEVCTIGQATYYTYSDKQTQGLAKFGHSNEKGQQQGKEDAL